MRMRRIVFRLGRRIINGITAISICVTLNANFVSAQDDALAIPLGLIEPDIPSSNPLTQDSIELGRMLFFDKDLSLNKSTSCATCHRPDHGFAEPRKVSVSANGTNQHRNAPSVVNSGFLTTVMWDGRFPSLENQALDPFRVNGDMGIDISDALDTIDSKADYKQLFLKAYGAPPNADNLGKALASFQRSLLSGNTRFDRYLFGGESNALTELEIQGYQLFLVKASCINCHDIFHKSVNSLGGQIATFTDNRFHNLGVGYANGEMQDTGRFTKTLNEGDFGAFKTPTLRNVALTAPYMHDGSIATLEDVVTFYNQGGIANPKLSVGIKQLLLSTQEKAALVAFLKSLTDTNLANLANVAKEQHRDATKVDAVNVGNATLRKAVGIHPNRPAAYVPHAGYLRTGDVLRLRRNAARRLSAAVPTRTAITGRRDVPVICTKFSNTGQLQISTDAISRHLFSSTAEAPRKSATQYYRDASGGLLEVQGTVVGWYELAHADSYYENQLNGGGTRFGELLKEAFVAADADVDFGHFDNDGPDGLPNSGDDDGKVDLAYVLHPEPGAECGDANASNIWSHHWHYSDSEFGHGAPFVTDDVRKDVYGNAMLAADGSPARIAVEDYAISGAVHCDSTAGSPKLLPIGVFCHEFGHALGLPDLYDRTPSDLPDSSGVGAWCIMASGSDGGDVQHPDTPTSLSAWCKLHLGWGELRTIQPSQREMFELEPVAKNGVYYRIDVPQSAGREFFLLEYRTRSQSNDFQSKINWDADLPTDGVAIWHVDESVGEGPDWPFADFNRGQNDSPSLPQAASHALVALEQADRELGLELSRGNFGDAGDLWKQGSLFADDDRFHAGTRSYKLEETGISVQITGDEGRLFVAVSTGSEGENQPDPQPPSDDHVLGYGDNTNGQDEDQTGTVNSSKTTSQPPEAEDGVELRIIEKQTPDAAHGTLPSIGQFEGGIELRIIERTPTLTTKHDAERTLLPQFEEGIELRIIRDGFDSLEGQHGNEETPDLGNTGESLDNSRPMLADVLKRLPLTKGDLSPKERALLGSLEEFQLQSDDALKCIAAECRTKSFVSEPATHLDREAWRFAGKSVSAKIRFSPDGERIEEIRGIELPTEGTPLQDASKRLEKHGSLFGSPILRRNEAVATNTIAWQQYVNDELPLLGHGVAFVYDDRGHFVKLESNLVDLETIHLTEESSQHVSVDQARSEVQRQLQVPEEQILSVRKGVYAVNEDPNQARVVFAAQLKERSNQTGITVYVDAVTSAVLDIK